jgi:hypothetical protein
MHPLIQRKRATSLFLIAMGSVWLGLLPNVQAVMPPPDGGYAGGNTAEGQDALLSLTTGTFNTANGFFSLKSNTTGDFNIATGVDALASNTTGRSNMANGFTALRNNTTGDGNTAAGFQVLFRNTTGTGNTALGLDALVNNTTGGNSVALNAFSCGNVTTASKVICIGAPAANVSNSCYIGGIFVQTSTDGTPVFVNSDGKLGTTRSSRRFKEEIRPMDKISEALFSLKPVSFHYKKEIDPACTSQLGLVAEDVEKVNPHLVVRDKEGKPYSVRYDQVNAMLLNEFLKEHRKVETLEATIAQQHKDFEEAVAELKGQIQKVSAQLELSKPAPQTVKNKE